MIGPIARAALLASALFAACGAAPGAHAGSVNEENGIAIRGYDPVAYFTAGRPTPGLRKHRARHEGATFLFATAANRDSFVANPAKYAPRYGGFCAYGASRGYKAAVDPAAFSVVGGRLYLNYDAEVKQLWSADVPGFVEKADRNWPEVVKTEKVYR